MRELLKFMEEPIDKHNVKANAPMEEFSTSNDAKSTDGGGARIT